MNSVLQISKFVALAASALLVANLLLGMLVATQYRKQGWWHKLPRPVQKIKLFTLHNYTAYVGLFLAVLHPSLLLFEPGHRYHLTTLLFPLHAPAQPLINALGTAALLLLLIVVFTSLKKVRKWFGFRRWKAIHFCAYAAAVLFLLHGLFINIFLKNEPVKLWDAERMISFFGLFLLILAAFLRLRFAPKKKRPPVASSFPYFK